MFIREEYDEEIKSLGISDDDEFFFALTSVERKLLIIQLKNRRMLLELQTQVDFLSLSNRLD